MFKKVVLTLCMGLLVFGLPVLAQDAPKTTWTCPSGFEGKTLTWFNWATYEAEDTRANFTKLCGLADTGEAIMGSNEDLIAKLGLNNPGYDVATPTGNVIPQMVREGLLEPIDISKIPNFANVSKFLQAPAYDPENKYSVPYQWGTIGVGYNKEAVGKEITSWEDVWSYQGNVVWLEDPRNMLGIALHLLGYDANTKNADEINAARDYLIDHSANVRAIAKDNGQESLLNGEADIAIEYSGDIIQIMSDCESGVNPDCVGKYQYLIPKEGTVIWVDNLAVPKDAPNPELAMAFMDYVLDAQVGADISNYTAYASPNQKAIDDKLISEDLLTNPIIYPTKEVSANLFSIGDVGDETARLYTQAWQEVTVLLGG